MIQYFKNRLFYIILIAAFAAIGSMVYTSYQDPKYTAVTTVIAENEGSSKLGNYASLAAQFGLDIGGSNSGLFQGENLMQFFRSRKLIDKTLLTPYKNNSLLIDKYVTNHSIKLFKYQGLNGKLYKDFKENEILFRDSLVNVVADEILKKRISIDRIDKKIDFIRISYVDNDQFFAKAFIENLVQHAITYYTNYKNQKNISNVNLLQNKADSVKALLYGNISSIASNADLNVNPIRQQLRVPSQRTQVNVQVNSAVYSEMVKNLELAKLVMQKEAPLVQIIDTPLLPLKNEKMGRILVGGLTLILVCLIQIFVLGVFYWYKFIDSKIKE